MSHNGTVMSERSNDVKVTSEWSDDIVMMSEWSNDKNRVAKIE